MGLYKNKNEQIVCAISLFRVESDIVQVATKEKSQIMKNKLKINRIALSGLSCLMLAQATAQASVVTLTFEGLKTYEGIGNFYNGGAGSLGSTSGQNYGISFGDDSLAIISDVVGGGGNFSGSPSMPTIAFFLTGSGDIMNVPSGFDTGFSFYYSAAVYSGSVSVYDGVNGTGNILATLDLPVTPTNPNGSYGTYNNWQPVGVSFSGTAKSVNFSGVANYIGFDNVTLGSQTPVPEPSTIIAGAMLLLPFGASMVRKLRKN
jgi:hypothetical protein